MARPRLHGLTVVTKDWWQYEPHVPHLTTNRCRNDTDMTVCILARFPVCVSLIRATSLSEITFTSYACGPGFSCVFIRQKMDPLPQSSAEVKERVELYLYSPSGPSWPVLGRALPFTVYTFYFNRCIMAYVDTTELTLLGNKIILFKTVLISNALWQWNFVFVRWMVSTLTHTFPFIITCIFAVDLECGWT